MARPLARTVYLDGIRYDPGDVPPPQIAARITNPKAWGQPPPDSPPNSARTREPAAEPVNDPGHDTTTAGPEAAPPRRGPGSAASNWAAYAKAHGLEVAAGASREDIIAALHAADVPTE